MRVLPTSCLLAALACGGPVTSGPQAASATPAEEPATQGESVPAAQHMRQHFEDVTAAREAVIQGDLAAVRVPLVHIASEEYGLDFPEDWVRWVEEMQEVARGAATAPTLDEAAQAVATLTASCADCHRTTMGGPAVPEDVDPPATPQSDALHERMVRHAWGAEQLWLGMTAPSHEAWVRGSKAISEDPLEAGPDDKWAGLEPELAEVRALGARAVQAGKPAEMRKVYGDLLIRCANCHDRLNVTP